MKQITLWKRGDKKSGLYALVDDENFELLNKHIWYAQRNVNIIYAITFINKKKIYMHQILLPNNDSTLTVDHENGNGLDNQETNLRLADKSQQASNYSIPSDNKSGYKGVFYRKDRNCWIAYITCKGIRLNLGQFPTKELAAQVYNEAALNYFGEFAKLNVIK